MNVFKKHKILTVLIGLLLVGLSVHYLWGYSFVYVLINNNSKEAKKYLKSTMVELTNLDSLSAIPSLDSTMESHQIFLIGEDHGIAINEQLEFAFLKYLKERGNVKYLLLEFPHSFSAKINRFICDGEVAYLDSAFAPLKGTDGWTIEFTNFFKRVYHYNRRLEDRFKIRSIGVDVENRSGAAIAFLKSMVPQDAAPQDIRAAIEKLRNIELNQLDHKSGWSIGAELLDDFQKKSGSYQTFLGEKCFEYKLILENVVKAKAVYEARKKKGYKAYATLRDSLMYENLKLFHKDFPDEKAFGFFGATHVMRDEFFGNRYFACLLEKENSPYKGKVLSMLINYKNCKAAKRPKYKVRNYNGPFQNEIFDFYKGDSPTLYYIDAEGSPFQSFRFYPTYSCGTADLVQYLLQVRNSIPSRPIKDPKKVFGDMSIL